MTRQELVENIKKVLLWKELPLDDLQDECLQLSLSWRVGQAHSKLRSTAMSVACTATPADVATNHVKELAMQRRQRAAGTLADIFEMSALPADTVEKLTFALQAHGRVAIHFHPDRLVKGGETVAGSLLATGCIQSQFESQISNGRVDSAPGGKRDQWENRLFGGAYEQAAPSLRPKYGALFLLGQSDGPAPRFGSCYFLLSPDATKRATFCYGDSHLDPPARGTWEVWEDILSELFQESFTRDGALGIGLRPPALASRILEVLHSPLSDKWSFPAARNLDHYIEAQVHGQVDLGPDVDALVADPSFKGTSVGAQLHSIASRYGMLLHWHAGSQLSVDEVPNDFRGELVSRTPSRKASPFSSSTKSCWNDWSWRHAQEFYLRVLLFFPFPIYTAIFTTDSSTLIFSLAALSVLAIPLHFYWMRKRYGPFITFLVCVYLSQTAGWEGWVDVPSQVLCVTLGQVRRAAHHTAEAVKPDTPIKTISVVMAAHNEHRYLKKFMDVEVEIIVIDDGSEPSLESITTPYSQVAIKGAEIPGAEPGCPLEHNPDEVKMMFDWKLHFKWFDDGNDLVPCMSGGLFGITKQWWHESGEYDYGMNMWGGENIEQSIRRDFDWYVKKFWKVFKMKGMLPRESFTVRDTRTGHCLEITEDGEHMHEAECTDQEEQRWTKHGDTLQSLRSKLCLDGATEAPGPQAERARLAKLRPCEKRSSFQKWAFEHGRIHFQKHCLDGRGLGEKLHLVDCMRFRGGPSDSGILSCMSQAWEAQGLPVKRLGSAEAATSLRQRWQALEGLGVEEPLFAWRSGLVGLNGLWLGGY
ncbi:GALNT11 [Symbiodinium sp. KB8]|nr:GALNT11 [Symbiodinium sp. KB8]